MFTGIVQDVGRVLRARAARGRGAPDGRRRRLDLSRASVGDSIAVAGVCLTVVALEPRAFSAECRARRSALTTIGGWRVGQRVNLEPALRAGDALGGHLVAGHVDGVAVVVNCARGRCARGAYACMPQRRWRATSPARDRWRSMA